MDRGIQTGPTLHVQETRQVCDVDGTVKCVEGRCRQDTETHGVEMGQTHRIAINASMHACRQKRATKIMQSDLFQMTINFVKCTAKSGL